MAVKLMACALAEVHIVDQAGRSFTPTEFVTEMASLLEEGDHPMGGTCKE
jgi:hypothetical protein